MGEAAGNRGEAAAKERVAKERIAKGRIAKRRVAKKRVAENRAAETRQRAQRTRRRTAERRAGQRVQEPLPEDMESAVTDWGFWMESGDPEASFTAVELTV